MAKHPLETEGYVLLWPYLSGAEVLRMLPTLVRKHLYNWTARGHIHENRAPTAPKLRSGDTLHFTLLEFIQIALLARLTSGAMMSPQAAAEAAETVTAKLCDSQALGILGDSGELNEIIERLNYVVVPQRGEIQLVDREEFLRLLDSPDTVQVFRIQPVLRAINEATRICLTHYANAAGIPVPAEKAAFGSGILWSVCKAGCDDNGLLPNGEYCTCKVGAFAKRADEHGVPVPGKEPEGAYEAAERDYRGERA